MTCTPYYTVSGPFVVGAHYVLTDKATREREYVLMFEVVGTCNTTDGEPYRDFGADDAIAELGFNLGAIYSGDTNARCRDMQCSFELENVCNVFCIFRTGIVQTDSPTSQPPIYDWDYQENEVPITYDIDGNAIANTAGVPFLPPLTNKYLMPVLSVEENLDDIDQDTIESYNNATNSDDFYGAAPGSLRCKIKATTMFDSDDGIYQNVKYVFFQAIDAQGDPAASPRTVVSMGFQEKVSGVLRPILDNEGNPVQEPALLNEAGAKTTTPYLQTFNVLPSLSYSALGV